jgi:tetratricopeptide (TPR) repeat protein
MNFSGGPSSGPEHFFSIAEAAYLRAVDLDGSYSKPRFGLGILYVFELDRPADAIPHLTRYLELMSSDVQAMFVLARAYYSTGSYDNAIELYDRIIARSKDSQIRAEAQNNKEIIMEQQYG